MKSFFKKLAFVMALAMVVSLAAPAAKNVAFAAELLTVCEQNDTTKTALATDELAVGESKDYRFIGAPSNWKEFKWGWKSSNEAVATVDKNGVVTGITDGEATITISDADANYVGAVKIIVGKGAAVDNTFTVKQTAANKVNVTFADAKQATSDVTLFKVFKTTSGDVEVAWPCKVSVKDGVATVEAYVDFVDGDEFVVKANGESQGFVSFVGPVTSIKVTTKVGTTKNVTYVNEAIEFEVKYFAGDIEVAPAAGSWVTFEALTPNEQIYIDSTYGKTSYIYAVGASTTVKAVYSYYDKEYNVVEIPYEFPVVGTPAPVEAYDSIKAVTVTNELTDASKVKWGETALIVGDTGYYVGLNVATTTAGTYFVNAPIKDKTAYPAELGTITFQSSDESKLLVGDNGYVTAIAEGSAVIIVKLTTTDANGNSVVKNVYAFNILIKPARKATTIKLSAPSISVLTDDNTVDHALTKGKITFEVVDQYGKTCGTSSATVKTTVKDAPELTATCAAGKGEVAISGTEYATINVSSILYTIEADKVKASFNVLPKKPATKDGSVVTTGYTVESKGLDVNVKQADVDKVTDGKFYAPIKVFTTWAGNKTGYVTDYTVFNKSDFFTKCEATLAKDDLVLKITDPDGKLVTPETDGVKVATFAADTKLESSKAGRYVVTLYSVTNVTPNTGANSSTSLIAYRQVASTTFEVKNTCKQMEVDKFAQGLSSTADTAAGVVAEIVSFKLDGKAVTVTADDIVKVKGVYNEHAGKLYVSSIVVKTKINDTNCYFEQALNIGKTFAVTADLTSDTKLNK